MCWIQNEVESKQNCILIKSTYKDNPFLSAEQVREIEDQKSDANWWKVYGCGLEGTLDGLIYEFEQIDELPVKTEMDHLVEIQGLDFGFTNDPTARVQVIADPRKKILYVRERCYQTHMQNKHIIQDLQDDGVGRRVEIYADCAEPKSIADIQDAGFNVIPCDKDAPVKSDKLKFQLQWMQGWKLYVTKDSLNLINELRNYTWAKDKDGTLLNQPIDKFNHCFTGDTLVMTDRGLVRIDHIVPGMRVATSDGYHRVVRLWENGCKKIWDITLKFTNIEIRMKVTPDHKIKVGEQWKKVSELKAGDRLWKLKSSMGRHIFSTGERDISQNGEETTTLMMRQESASSVEKNSVPTDIAKQYVGVEYHIPGWFIALYHFAFASEYDMMRWFTREEREELSSKGFYLAVYEVPEDEVIIGGHQVMFRKYNLKHRQNSKPGLSVFLHQ